MNIIKATESDGIELLYSNKSLAGVPFNNVKQFNLHADSLELEQLVDSIEYSKQFNIPQHYLKIDVEQYIRGLVATADAKRKARVEAELDLFRTRNLFSILQLLIYIIDIMRKHNLVWGVGRGSSVASYCLYLIGVHKIDSVEYDLDIREFLK
jgi:DNA polymerase III alpha subunit